MAKYCKKCGKVMDDDAVFCDECGTSSNPNAEKPKNSFSSFNSNYNPFSSYKIDMIDGESVIDHSKIHSGCLYAPLILIVIGFILMILTRFILFPIFVLGLIWFLIIYIIFSNTDLILTNKRIFGKCGVISTIQMQSPLYMVNSVSFSNGLMGKLLGYGTIRISTASSIYKFRYIKDAQTFYNDIFNQLVISEKEKILEQDEANAKAMKEN